MEQLKMAPGAGRPRDERVDQRALAATREVFAERGWFGTSYDEVAKRAGVGKSSLYLRWGTKAELVVAALNEGKHLEGIDTGGVREDLMELARVLLARQWSGDAAASYRFAAESRHVPELRAAAAAVKYSETVQAARRIVRRAITRGELPQGTSPTMLNDLISGAIMRHAMVSAHPITTTVRNRSHTYLVELVDTVLAGLVHRFD
jgi:AcrR family transcriptional regulator